jgi:pyridoxamine 5'-phosphate oxidase
MKIEILSETNTDPDPVIQFGRWYNEHLNAGIAIPDTVSLGTASLTGRVSVRTVLLKGFDEYGFVFYTNYTSRKGIQLSENRHAAMLFYWPESSRQVRIEGVTEKLSGEESTSYFGTRPRGSQIGAWASEQSSVIPDRQYLDRQYRHFSSLFENKKVDKPPQWGGIRLIPDYFEFWKEGENRLHDRIEYRMENGKWMIRRLAP